MAKTYAVIGLGKFGSAVALALADRGYQVMAIDQSEDKINDISERVTQAVVLDATDAQALRDAGVAESEVAIISVGNRIDTSVLIALLLKDLGVREVIVKALDDTHAKILSRIGADRILFPEREMAARLAESLISPKIFDYIELSPTHSVAEIAAPHEFHGKSLRQLDLRGRFGVSVIAIKRRVPFVTEQGTPDFREEVNISPSADDELVEGDVVVLLGSYENLDKVSKL